MRALLVISIFGLLFLTACDSTRTKVFNNLGNTVGQVKVQDSDNARIERLDGTDIGKVTDTIVRNEDDERIGRIVSDTVEATIFNRNGTMVGSLKDVTDCYDDNGRQIGKLAAAIDPEAAAGACLLLLLL